MKNLVFNKKEILAILHSKNTFGYKNYSANGFNAIAAYYGSSSWLLNLIRRVCFCIKLPISKIWYTKLPEKKISTLIVHETLITKEYLIWLKAKFPKAKLILFYDNIEEDARLKPYELIDGLCDKWTFDPNQAYLYKMNLCISGIKERCLNNKNMPVIYDTFFVGHDKGRLVELIKLKEKLINIGLKPYIHVVPDKTYLLLVDNNYKLHLSKKNAQNILDQSKSVLSFSRKGSTGIDLRIYDALSKGKKVITNNKSVTRYEFYSKNNFFILNVDKFENIYQFLNSPFLELDKKIIERYSFNYGIYCMTRNQPVYINEDNSNILYMPKVTC